MMTTNTSGKMICPNCGAKMNHHGDKLVYAADSEKTARLDENPVGFLEEFHSCPQCGSAASRRAAA
jgi:predicted RNA-binding Zn-ribbon protein involved in translation (DUF1610 family)